MAIDAEALLNLIKQMNPYSKKMYFNHLPSPETSVTSDERRDASHEPSIGNIQMEIDNYKGEWTFRGGTEQIKRSLRLTYRYPILVMDEDGEVVRDESGNAIETGLYATEHLLIGYAGGNH